jgi:hypothetical protein
MIPCRFLVDVFREAHRRAWLPRPGSRDVASHDERWPLIVALDSNRDFVVEFVALRAS